MKTIDEIARRFAKDIKQHTSDYGKQYVIKLAILEATQELQKDRERFEFYFGNVRAEKSKAILDLHCKSLSKSVSIDEWRKAIDKEIAAITQQQKEKGRE